METANNSVSLKKMKAQTLNRCTEEHFSKDLRVPENQPQCDVGDS